MGAAVAPLALAGLSAGGNALMQRDVARRQDRELARGIAAQRVLQQQANQRVNQEINRAYGSEEPQRRAALGGYLSQLRRARSADAGSVAGASNRYGADVTGAAETSQEAATQLADLMSRIDAPALQRQQQGQNVARTGFELERLGQQSAAADYLARLRAQSVRANPWTGVALQLAGSGAQLLNQPKTQYFTGSEVAGVEALPATELGTDIFGNPIMGDASTFRVRRPVIHVWDGR